MKPLLGITVAILFAAIPALAGDDLNFKLNNDANAPVIGFYVSHSGSNSWEDNLIEGHALAPHASVNVVIADGRGNCKYDIRLEFADGRSADDHGIDFCETDGYTVRERG